MRRLTIILLPLLLICGSAAATAQTGHWCEIRCDELFAAHPEKPDCELWDYEHVIREDKIIRRRIVVEACKAQLDRWYWQVEVRDQAREALKDGTGCADWCGRVSALRKGEPLGEGNRHLWQAVADVILCRVTGAQLADLTMFHVDVRCPGMRFVAPGPFMMGCDITDETCRDREKPYHEIHLDAYFIDTHEVTSAAYRRCVEQRKCSRPRGHAALDYYNFGADARSTHPINGVDWAEADAYCAFAGKRLCSEAEWEKGARGDDGRDYPWGPEKPSSQLAVLDTGIDPSGEGRPWPVLSLTSPVCSREKGNSPYGLCDMAGNVWEWVADWYLQSYYKTTPAANPRGPAEGTHRVIRGGRFSNVGFSLRTSARGYLKPEAYFPYLGFRCCKGAAE